MADFAALRVASNILRFIRLGINLYTDGKEIFDSTQGTSRTTEELEAIIKHMREDQKKFNIILDRIYEGKYQSKDWSISDVAQMCEPLSKDLLETLEALKLPQGSEGMKRHLRSMWKHVKPATHQKQKFDELKQRFLDIDSLLKERLMVLLQEYE